MFAHPHQCLRCSARFLSYSALRTSFTHPAPNVVQSKGHWRNEASKASNVVLTTVCGAKRHLSRPAAAFQSSLTPPARFFGSRMASTSADKLAAAFRQNKQWAAKTASSKPDLFPKLAKGQSPQILWIGCSDSRCPETTILDLEPGDVFVHRNIANIVHPADLSANAVIDYAVSHIKVNHIVLCGHTSCGGVAAAMGNNKLGLIDTWLLPLRMLRRENIKLLESLEAKEAALKLIELNVHHGVKTLRENAAVLDAMADRGLQVHGAIYNVGTGELTELETPDDEETVQSREKAFKTKLSG